MAHYAPTGDWIELFDGKSLAGWRAQSPDGQQDWIAVGDAPLRPDDRRLLDVVPGEGILINGPAGRTANLYTEFEHGDCHLHLEFVVPERSNSGVYFMGKYEVQVLDSWGVTELTYGTCGGIYHQWINEQGVGGHAPRVNASRPPDEWQSFDVVFHAPRFDEKGNKISYARFVSVVWNGHVVHEDAEIKGPTRASMPAVRRREGLSCCRGIAARSLTGTSGCANCHRGHDLLMGRDRSDGLTAEDRLRAGTCRCWGARGLRAGQGEGRGRALALLALEPQLPSVAFHQGSGDGQPQPTAALGSGTGPVRPVEALSDAGQVLRRNPDALIPYLHAYRPFLSSIHAHRHRALGL